MNRMWRRALGFLTLLILGLGGPVQVGVAAAGGTDVAMPVCTCDYDVTAQRVQVADVRDSGKESVGPNESDLASAQPSRVAAKSAPGATNKIYSNRVLQRMADEPGPMHNFPGYSMTRYSPAARGL